MTEDDFDRDETDWQELVRLAVEKLSLAKPLKLADGPGPSCTLRAAVARVFGVRVSEARRVCEMFEYDPDRRVRAPQ